jgi:hypothetical protein
MAFIAIVTDNPLGKRPLNHMVRHQALGWFGAAPTPGDYDNNQQVLGQLVAMGAITQQDASDIWTGQASLDDMAVNMTMINQALQFIGQTGAAIPAALPPSTPAKPPASGGATVVPYTPTPASNPPLPPTAPAVAQIPPGSTIVYNATFNPVAGWTTSNAAISALAPLLPTHGMSMLSPNVASSGLVSNAAFSVTIMDSIGHALMSDAKSILDALMEQITNRGLIQSSIAMVSAGLSPGGSPNPQAPNITTFLENNAPLLIGLVLAIVVLPGLIKKL